MYYIFIIIDLEIGNNPILSHSDRVIGQILHLSTMECPTLSKSWFTLAGWCYKWGRKSVDNARLVSTFSWFYMKFYLILTFLDFITSLTVYYQRHWFTVYSMGQMSYCHHFANVVFSFIDEVFWNYWTQWRERAGMFHETKMAAEAWHCLT